MKCDKLILKVIWIIKGKYPKYLGRGVSRVYPNIPKPQSYEK